MGPHRAGRLRGAGPRCVTREANRVHGVKAVANDIEVRLDGDGQRTDTDIASGAPRNPHPTRKGPASSRRSPETPRGS